MKHLPAVLLLTALPLAATSLTQAERDTLLAQLSKSAAVFLNSLEGVSEAQWNYKPGPDRWSIAECAEHVAIADQMMFVFASQQLLKMTPPEKAQHRSDESVLDAALDRTKKVKTAELLEPKGRYASKAAVLEAFEKGRARIVEYVKTTKNDLRAHGLESANGYTDALPVPAQYVCTRGTSLAADCGSKA